MIRDLEINEIIDGQRVGGRTILLLALAFITLMSDGFDLAAIGYVGPELSREWGLSSAGLVPVFTSGIIGLLFGAPLFGLLGDRFGRRKAILSGLCLFGIVSLLTALATTLPQLVIMRFLTGVGLGGVIPNVASLVAEMSPKRFRGAFVVFVNFGVAAGISISGIVAAALIPLFGWQSLVIVGGILPLCVAAISYFLMPESLRFKAQRLDTQEDLLRTARRIRPDLDIQPGTAIIYTVPQGRAALAKDIFRNKLSVATPMIWIALAANQMANFFALTWLPTLLQSMGSTTAEAGMGGSFFALGSLLGGVFLIFLIDRFGVIPLVVMFFAGAPLIAAIGMVENAHLAQWLIIAGAGLCVNGINFGTNAVLAIIYPTEIRSFASGWAQAAGRLGALAAPIIGGTMLGLHFTMQQVLVAPALLLAVGGLATAILTLICVRQFGGLRLGEFTGINVGESLYPGAALAKQKAL